MAMVSLFPENYCEVSRSTEPTDLIRFVEFGGYRRHYWDGVSATAREEGSYDVRVATMVAESHKVVQQSQRKEFKYTQFRAWGNRPIRKVDQVRDSVTHAKEVCYPDATQNGPPVRTRYLQWSELLLFPNPLLALRIRTVLRRGSQERVPLRRHGGLGVSGGMRGRPPFGTIFKAIADRWNFSQLTTTVTSCVRSSRWLALEAA